MRLLGRGQLQVHAGRLIKIRADRRANLELQLRNGRRRTLVVDRIVNAMGVETQVARSPNPFIRRLLTKGVLQPGPHGIGVATDANGRVLDRAGSAMPDVYTLGSARIGQLWESIAIPELRVQAEQIARLILGQA